MTRNADLPVVFGTGGSPRYSDKVRREILASLKIGSTRTAAYGAAGISEPTFYRWLKEDESFRESVEQAEAAAERTYTRLLRAKAQEGDTQAIKFWLERRRAANWREKTSIELGAPTLEDELDEALNSDDVERRIEALADEALRRRASRAGRDAEGAPGPEAGTGEPS